MENYEDPAAMDDPTVVLDDDYRELMRRSNLTDENDPKHVASPTPAGASQAE